MIDQAIDALIDREGGYVEHPSDRGGPCKFGITEAVARAQGYNGKIVNLPRQDAVDIYRRLYWLRPRFDEIALRSERLAMELFDTGVNMGPAVAVTFLQRALTALNRNNKDYPDLMPDGRVGPTMLAALDTFLKIRGQGGETIMLQALEALQGERYLRLAERRPSNETFLYGWLANRVSDTQPKAGDVQQAPLGSGAVTNEVRQTPRKRRDKTGLPSAKFTSSSPDHPSEIPVE